MTLLIALAVGSKMVSLERGRADALMREKTAVERTRLLVNFGPDKPALQRLTVHHFKLNESIRTSLDRITATVAHDPGLNGPGLQEVRTTLLQNAVDFWGQAIESDADPDGNEGPRTKTYRLDRALCIARLGDYQLAVREAQGLLPWVKTNEPTGAAMYDLARIYALCAATSEDQQYADDALEMLRQAAAAGYFRNAAAAERLRKDPDLAPLASRGEFGELLEQLELNATSR
jgi:hypothetical protein